MKRYDLFIIILLINLFVYDFYYLGLLIASSYISANLVEILKNKIKEYKEIKKER